MEKTNTGNKSVQESFNEEYQRTLDAKNEKTNQDTTKEGSESTPPVSTVEPAATFKMPDGRELTADQVFQEYGNLQKDYTQKTQELSQLKKTTQPQQSETEPDKTRIAPSRGGEVEKKELSAKDQALLAELKRLGVITNDKFEEEFATRKQEILKDSAQFTETRLSFKEKLEETVKQFDGSDGKPKVTQEEILGWYESNGYPNLSPDKVAKIVKTDDFIKYEARQLAGQGGTSLPQTEGNGAGVTTPPKPPQYNFKDGSAERAVREILGTT